MLMQPNGDLERSGAFFEKEHSMRLALGCGAAALAVGASASAQTCGVVRSSHWVQEVVAAVPATSSPILLHANYDWIIVADIDRDGCDDVIVAMPECERHDCFGTGGAGDFNLRRPVAHAYSGRTGELLSEYVSPTPARVGGLLSNQHFGSDISAADIDGDGDIEIAIAAPGERVDLDGDGVPDGVIGRVTVFDASTGDVLYTMTGDAPLDWFGRGVEWVGDWTGDGVRDLLVARLGHQAGGQLDVRSGVNGEIVGTTGRLPMQPIWKVWRISDVSGDGQDDGVALVQSSDTELTCWVVHSVALAPNPAIVLPPDVVSTHIETVGDVNGDGAPELGWTRLLFQPENPVTMLEFISTLDGAAVGSVATPFGGCAGDCAEDAYLPPFPIGDVNYDGVQDVALAPFLIWDGAAHRDHMRLISLADGACIADWTTRDPSITDVGGIPPQDLTYAFQRIVRGDFDGDGVGDLATAAKHSDVGASPFFTTQINFFRRPGCPEDLNGDGHIDFADISLLLDTFNDIDAPGMLPSDVDGNGQVDFGDLNHVLARMNSGC